LASNPALDRVDRPMSTGSADGLSSVAYQPSAAELLLSEVTPLLHRDDWWLAGWILADLDQRGFLGRDARSLSAELGVDEARVSTVIDAIRVVGPPGICAADTTECLLLQLEILEADGRAPHQLRKLITCHLPDLAKGRTGTVAAALGVDSGEVLALRDFLRTHLRPWAVLDAPASRPVPAAHRTSSSAPRRTRPTSSRWSSRAARPRYGWIRSGPISPRTGTRRSHRPSAGGCASTSPARVPFSPALRNGPRRCCGWPATSPYGSTASCARARRRTRR